MAITTTAVPVAVPVSDIAKALPFRRRRITPAGGRALEKLGHAIEYLMDEDFHERPSSLTSCDRSVAVQVLMGLRRQVHLDAPEIQPVGERLRHLLAGLLP